MSSNNKTTNMYPVYHDGSVLKSEDLNMSFDFLHSQLKSTRNLLFGQGIVSGLTCSYNKASGELIISSGVAVTRSGAIVEVSGNKVYDKCVAIGKYRENGDGITYPEGTEYVLIEKDANEQDLSAAYSGARQEYEWGNEYLEDAVQLSDEKINFDDFLLAIQVSEQLIGSQKYCTNLSCTYSGDKVLLEIVPVLIRKQKQQDETNAADEETTSLDGKQVNLDYMKPIDVVSHGWADYNILPVFLRQAANHFYEKTRAVAISMNKITEYMRELQSQYFTFAKILEYEGCDYISQLGTMAFDNRYIATCLSFANDMVSAANELITKYNQFLYKYRLTEVQQGAEYDNAILLGSVSENESSSDRNSFQTHYQDTGRAQDESILVRLYNRVLLMIKYFNPQQACDTANRMLLPVNSESPLGEGYMPKYYGEENNSDMKEYWDAHHPYHEEPMNTCGNPINDVSDFTTYDYRKADTYLLYGYEYIFSDTLKEYVQMEIREKNLPIIVLEHELEGDESSYALEQYNPSAKEPASDIKDIVASLMGEGVVYRNKTDYDFIFGSESAEERSKITTALTSIMKLRNEQNIAEASKYLKVLDYSKIEEIRQAIYLMAKDDEKILSTSQKRELEYLLLVVFYYYNTNMLKSYYMPGVDYISGVKKNDVLLIVTHNKRAIACLNMPAGCLAISSDKYKNQLADYIIDGTGSVSSILGFESLEYMPNNPFALEDKAKYYDIYMLHYGRNKQNTADYFRRNMGMTLTAAKNLVSKTMALIYKHVTLSEAKQITYTLNEGYKAPLLYVPEGKFIATNSQLSSIEDCTYANIVATLIDNEEKKSELMKVFNTCSPKQEAGEDGKITITLQQVEVSKIFLNKSIIWNSIDAVLEIKPGNINE